MTIARRGCVYHLRPSNMLGTILHPLNELVTLAPDVYRREIAKYDDHPSRRQLPGTWLPGLECRWSDVIHCSAIHPYQLYEEWRRHREAVDPDLHFFAIPIAAVSHLPLAIMRPAGGGGSRDVTLISADAYEELTTVPAATRAWYSKLSGKGRFGAHFVGVPHVLARGSIDTRGMPLIRWSDPSTDR